MEERKPVWTGRNIATAVFLLLGNFLIIAAVWVSIRFGTIDMTAILFQLKVPISGADPTNFYEIFILLFTIGPVATAVEIGILVLIAKIRNKRKAAGKKAKVSSWITEHRRMVAVFFMIIAICIVGYRLHVVKYVINQFGNSPIYKDEYVDPKTAVITAPEQKRNLIYIYMESMEISYSEYGLGGASRDNMIPEMSSIAIGNTCFNGGTGTLNGANSCVGTTWTMGSLVAQTAGVPLTIPIGENAMGKKAYKTFLPGTYTLGEVLRDNGYELMYLIGSEKNFSGADIYMTTHGNYEIRDLHYYHKHGLPSDYYVWWGFEDEKVYEYAKQELTTLSQCGKPFAFTMMTMDTHFTNGYRCRLCPDTYSDQYSNVIACASRQLQSFLDWFIEQPFCNNTTIVIVGDHPTMDTKYTSKLPYNKDGYVRKCYCAVLNGVAEEKDPKYREFTPMDMYPTTLAALGFEIQGNRLGLGVNLYSGEQTILEKYGWEELNDLLEERSDFYDSLMYGTTEE